MIINLEVAYTSKGIYLHYEGANKSLVFKVGQDVILQLLDGEFMVVHSIEDFFEYLKKVNNE